MHLLSALIKISGPSTLLHRIHFHTQELSVSMFGIPILALSLRSPTWLKSPATVWLKNCVDHKTRHLTSEYRQKELYRKSKNHQEIHQTCHKRK